jgi:hypothetical protein
VGAGGYDQMVVGDLSFLAVARGLDDDVAIVGVHSCRIALDQAHVEPVIDWLEREAGTLGLHVTYAHPHQRGIVQKAVGAVDHGDLVVAAQCAAQVEGRRLACETGADDSYLRHLVLPSFCSVLAGRTAC